MTSVASERRRVRRAKAESFVINGARVVTKRSEGQRMLLYVEGTIDAVRLALGPGTSRQSIFDWRQGVRKPSAHARNRMLDAFGIPPESWLQRWNDAGPLPGDPIPPPPPALLTVVPNAPDAHDAAIDAIAAAEPSAATGSTTIQHCISLLASIRRERIVANLLPSERVKLVDSEARMLKLLADLQARDELSEDRYVREHPGWIRVRNAIADALRAHPAAAQAVAEALERVGA